MVPETLCWETRPENLWKILKINTSINFQIGQKFRYTYVVKEYNEGKRESKQDWGTAQ